ncbi:MAG: hypothetical protein AABX01_07015 [Candidatus Micrarchaeota archaeon]
MDVTIRRLDELLFRQFKARCAEMGISMGGGFNKATRLFLGENANIPRQKKAVERDLHTLTDLSQHIHELRKANAQTQKKK